MAFVQTQFLNANQTVTLRDQQHAARLFVDDQFRLAPKFNFLFHVAFGINSSALMNLNLVQRHNNEINMLVKKCDLPNFTIKTETLNQYNRKKNTQVTHTYNPIGITFHDDNMGLINQLWQNYYNYYYADPSSAKDPGSYARNATKNFSYVKNTYGFDNGSQLPFFKYIKIYQMARHEFVEYRLYNPIITSWNHNSVSSSDSGIHDQTMQIAYEAVSYNTGTVSAGSPEGFGQEHYDKTPSPLTGVRTGTASPSFASAYTVDKTAFINNASTTVNTYQNTGALPVGGIYGIINSVSQTAISGVSGLSGIEFPVYQTPAETIAKLTKL